MESLGGFFFYFQCNKLKTTVMDIVHLKKYISCDDWSGRDISRIFQKTYPCKICRKQNLHVLGQFLLPQNEYHQLFLSWQGKRRGQTDSHLICDVGSLFSHNYLLKLVCTTIDRSEKTARVLFVSHAQLIECDINHSKADLWLVHSPWTDHAPTWFSGLERLSATQDHK